MNYFYLPSNFEVPLPKVKNESRTSVKGKYFIRIVVFNQIGVY
jgi:hypothetical protein